MRRLILSIIIMIISTFIVNGQSGTKKENVISIGLDAGFPFGSLLVNNVYTFAIGGFLQTEFLMSKKWGVVLSAGYLNYFGREIYGFADERFIPVLTGLQYHLKNKIYFSGQLGIAFSATKNSVTGGGILFSYCPGVGFQFTKNIGVLAKYEAVYKNNLTIGDIGIRLAYSF
jgi:hypothetical protein